MFSTRIILLRGAMPLMQDRFDTPRNILSESQDVLHTGLSGLPAFFRLFLFCRARFLTVDGTQIHAWTDQPEGCLLYTSPSPRD